MGSPGVREDANGAPAESPESGYRQRSRADGADRSVALGPWPVRVRGYGLADDVYAFRIIAGTGGFLVGILGNEVSARRDNGSARGNDVSARGNDVSAWGNEVSPRGNEVSVRGNEGTDRGNDSGEGGDKPYGVRIEVYTADNFVGGGALVLLGATARLIGRGAIG